MFSSVMSGSSPSNSAARPWPIAETAPEIDILVVPSAEHSMDRDLENEEMMEWVRRVIHVGQRGVGSARPSDVQDTLAGLREMTRVCRPGGRVAVLDFDVHHGNGGFP